MKTSTDFGFMPNIPMVVHKQTLHRIPRQELSLPIDSTFLSTQIQHDTITIWYATYDPTATETVTFYICGTGAKCIHNHRSYYAGTVQDGPLIWHIFFSTQSM